MPTAPGPGVDPQGAMRITGRLNGGVARTFDFADSTVLRGAGAPAVSKWEEHDLLTGLIFRGGVSESVDS